MMSHHSSARAEYRLAAIIMIIAELHGEPHTAGPRMSVPLTRQDLAENVRNDR